MYRKSRRFVAYIQWSSTGVINNMQLTINKVTISLPILLWSSV